jgi:uncharacterized C2H2 Zn-finger protein
MAKYHKNLPVLENSDVSHCPNCKTSWNKEDIFIYFLKKYINPIKAYRTAMMYGYNIFTRRYHFRRLRGIEIRGEYDGVSYWECPECNMIWQRNFPKFDYSKMTQEQRSFSMLINWFKRNKK